MVEPNPKSAVARLECKMRVLPFLLILCSLAPLNVQAVGANETNVESLVKIVISTNKSGNEMVAVRKLVADTNSIAFSVASFVTALKSDDWEVRRMAAWALWWFGTNAASGLESLTNLLADRFGKEDTESRWQYIRALGSIGEHATSALPFLFNVFAGTNQPTPLRLDSKQAIISVDVHGALRPALWEMWRDRRQADGWRRAALDAYQGTNDFDASCMERLCVTLEDGTETAGTRDKAAEMLIRGTTNIFQRYRQKQMGAFDAERMVNRGIGAFVAVGRQVPVELDRSHTILREATRYGIILTVGVPLAVLAIVAFCAFVLRQRAIRGAWKALCVIENRIEGKQGTAFWIKNIGLVTCDHVTSPDSLAFRTDDPGRTAIVSVVARASEADVALLSVALKPAMQLEAATSAPSVQQKVFILGFPKFARGASGTILQTRIVGERFRFGKKRWVVDKAIVVGSSGGSVLNARGKVIGMADCGIKNRDELGDAESTFIPIEEIIRLANHSRG